MRAGGDHTLLSRCRPPHLVEHLALFGLGPKQPYSFNGWVDGLRTSFYATGTPEQVANFMSGVCAGLANLPLERLKAEARVIRAELAQRQIGPHEIAQRLRFSARGHGLTIEREYAMDAPRQEAVQAWAAERFTAENACACFTGPIPAGLGFEALPRGGRLSCPEATPIKELVTPAVAHVSTPLVLISAVYDRATWASVPLGYAGQRVQGRVRYQEGLAYSLQQTFHPVSASQNHPAMWMGCDPEDAAVVQERLLDVLDELGRDGPTAEELEESRHDFARRRQDPAHIYSELQSALQDELLGVPVDTAEDLQAELDAMTPQRCAAAMHRMLETSILFLPPGCAPCRDSFHPYRAGPQMTVAGRRFHPTAQRFPWSTKSPQLIVGDEGVSMVTPAGEVNTILYRECAGAIAYADRELRLIGDDGAVIEIDADRWRDGQWARQGALRRIPIDLVLTVPDG